MAFHLGTQLLNVIQRLTLPETIRRWSLRSAQAKLIKTGGQLVRHAWRLVFQLAEVMVTREVFEGMLERVWRLRPATG